MGGEGSGNRYRFNKKTTVEECRSLDVRRLHREGLLEPGYRFSWSWARAGRRITSIGGVVIGSSSRPERVVLLFRHRSALNAEWEDVREPVELAWTPCNFGGERPWFLCPGVVRGVACGRRVQSCTGRGNTSCADTATTSVTRASVRTRRTGLSGGRRR